MADWLSSVIYIITSLDVAVGVLIHRGKFKSNVNEKNAVQLKYKYNI